VLDADSFEDLTGTKAWEFVVMDSRRLGLGDLTEYEATVIRSEGVPARAVNLI
jgi:hypothetical protein